MGRPRHAPRALRRIADGEVRLHRDDPLRRRRSSRRSTRRWAGGRAVSGLEREVPQRGRQPAARLLRGRGAPVGQDVPPARRGSSSSRRHAAGADRHHAQRPRRDGGVVGLRREERRAYERRAPTHRPASAPRRTSRPRGPTPCCQTSRPPPAGASSRGTTATSRPTRCSPRSRTRRRRRRRSARRRPSPRLKRHGRAVVVPAAPVGLVWSNRPAGSRPPGGLSAIQTFVQSSALLP